MCKHSQDSGEPEMPSLEHEPHHQKIDGYGNHIHRDGSQIFLYATIDEQTEQDCLKDEVEKMGSTESHSVFPRCLPMESEQGCKKIVQDEGQAIANGK